MTHSISRGRASAGNYQSHSQNNVSQQSRSNGGGGSRKSHCGPKQFQAAAQQQQQRSGGRSSGQNSAARGMKIDNGGIAANNPLDKTAVNKKTATATQAVANRQATTATQATANKQAASTNQTAGVNQAGNTQDSTNIRALLKEIGKLLQQLLGAFSGAGGGATATASSAKAGGAAATSGVVAGNSNGNTIQLGNKAGGLNGVSQQNATNQHICFCANKDGSVSGQGKNIQIDIKHFKPDTNGVSKNETPTPPPAQEKWSATEVKNGKAELKLGERYSVKLDESNHAWTVVDNQDQSKTRIWGDPHVDIGHDGKTDFDFKKNATFQLEDGTKLTVDTIKFGNAGASVSSKLTITKGQNAFEVSGLGHTQDGANNLSIKQSNNGVALDAAKDDGAFTAKEAGKSWTIDGKAVTQALVNQKEAH